MLSAGDRGERNFRRIQTRWRRFFSRRSSSFRVPDLLMSMAGKIRFSAIFRFGITPLFLFSGTFFPISSLPEALQVVAWATPLFHGVALTRGLSLGTIADEPLAAVVHVVYLTTLAVVGARLTIRNIERRLVRG